MPTRYAGLLAPAIVFLAIGVAWQASVRLSGVLPLILPGPGDVLAAALHERARLLAAAGATLSEIVLAAVIAIAAGFVTAAAMSMSATARRVIFPYVLVTQVVPKVALAPILVAWFGIGMNSRLILAVLIAFFPMVINTLAGLVGTGEPLVRYARSLAASEWQILRQVRLPAALPSIVGGMKITTAMAVIGIVVGEFVASDSGLGMVITNSVASLNTALTIAATLTIALIGLGLLGIIELVERWLVYWQPGK